MIPDYKVTKLSEANHEYLKKFKLMSKFIS